MIVVQGKGLDCLFYVLKDFRIVSIQHNLYAAQNEAEKHSSKWKLLDQTGRFSSMERFKERVSTEI